MKIQPDDPRRPAVRALLEEHLRDMHAITPAGSVHALDVDALCVPAVTFWTARHGETVLGCGALKELDPTHGEVKSMRTAAAHRQRGVGRAILEQIIAEARVRSYSRLSLETGAAAPFHPAHRLYESFGFTYCGPFVGYVEDPNSVFLTLELR